MKGSSCDDESLFIVWWCLVVNIKATLIVALPEVVAPFSAVDESPLKQMQQLYWQCQLESDSPLQFQGGGLPWEAGECGKTLSGPLSRLCFLGCPRSVAKAYQPRQVPNM